MDMDFTDNFFSNLNQPFPFPNPRELGEHCSHFEQTRKNTLKIKVQIDMYYVEGFWWEGILAHVQKGDISQM